MNVEDLTGLGKVVDSKLANKIYDEGLSASTQEIGKALTDTAKVLRLFTAPLQLLAVAQDRLSVFCGRVREGVPENRQIEAIPSIAGPVLMELRYMEDENPLTDLYLNLLKRAIDRERVNEAHPAFIKIIGQLCPDEVLILHYLKESSIYNIDYRNDDVDHSFSSLAKTNFPIESLVIPSNFSIYLEHLEFLNLTKYYWGMEEADKSIYPPIEGTSALTSTAFLTAFGKLFVTACEP